MVLIGQDVIEIYEEQEDVSCGEDNYGHPLKCRVLIERRGNCSFQPESNIESKEASGDMVQDTAVLILPFESNITSSSIIKPLNKKYSGDWFVNGTPQVYNTLIPHIQVDLIKERV